MTGFNERLSFPVPVAWHAGGDVIAAFAAGLLASTPIMVHGGRLWTGWQRRNRAGAWGQEIVRGIINLSFYGLILLLSLLALASGAHNPFIYYRF
jgi:hypothetical protein